MRTGESFTQRVVAELAPYVPPLACCRGAAIEGMALVSTCAASVGTTRLVAARAALQVLHADGVPAHVRRVTAARRHHYVLDGVDVHARPVLAAGRLCCARSRLRGAFLAAGRLGRPDADPFLEIGCAGEAQARQLIADFAALSVASRTRLHRGRWVLEVRSGPGVGAALSSIGVQGGRLDYEAGRVLREVRSGVNRRLNAETANLHRSADAGVRQLESIAVLEAEPARWSALPGALREAAALRRSHPDDDLARLAARAGCSRSAMAGRLRRLVAAAAEPGASPG